MKKVMFLTATFFTLLNAATLQDMYNNASPGEGYDKLIILAKDSVYDGRFVQDVQSVCIHGNGAIIALNDSSIIINGDNKRIDIDHVIFITKGKAEDFLIFQNNAFGKILNNTFYGKSDSGKAAYCIRFNECNKDSSYIQNNIFTDFQTGIYYYTMNFDSGITLNISHNDLWKCDTPYLYWGGWTGFPSSFTPNPGDQELLAEPKFIAEQNHNFNLSDNSPCIDYGIILNFGFQGNAPDLGAKESSFSKFIGTKISGELDNDLTISNSPYIIISDIIIPQDKKINIDPGVVLKLNASKSIYVYGELNINGTKSDSIYIGNNSIYNIHWGNIVFTQGSSISSNINYSVIKNGSSVHSYSGAVSCYNDSTTISNNYFSGNGISIFCTDGSKANISSNIFFEHNNFTGAYIIYCNNNSRPIITRNTFYNSALLVDSADAEIIGNKFMGQKYYVGQQYWELTLRNGAKAYLVANYFQDNYGAVLINESNCNAYNNLLVNCENSFLYSNSSGILSNNTIYSNGSGIITDLNSKISVANSIIWCTGEYSQSIHPFNSSTVDAEYCILSTTYSGEHIIYDNPLFVNSDSGNFHLTKESPGINTGTPDTVGLLLPLIDYDGNKRIVGTRIDIGCYESSVIDGINGQIKQTPKNFTLFQNYPNPFNPVTIINYSIPITSWVQIKIYDALGREIKTLVNEERIAGNYKINFNANGLSNGVYFYRMQAGIFDETKKLILLK